MCVCVSLCNSRKALCVHACVCWFGICVRVFGQTGEQRQKRCKSCCRNVAVQTLYNPYNLNVLPHFEEQGR